MINANASDGTHSVAAAGWAAFLRLVSLALACSPTGAIDSADLQARAEEPALATRSNAAGHESVRKGRLTDARRNTAGPDCNGNGVPDDQDIDNCAGGPACDDCNLNDLPDECDISSGTSTDSDLDGMPDECVFYDDGGADSDWSTPENWDDDEVPNNLDLIDDESATIDAFGVNLDLKVQIDTLRLRDGTTLKIMGGPSGDEDLFVKELGGILITSETAVQSRMLLGDGRRIMVEQGTLELASGGLFDWEPPAAMGGLHAAAVAATESAPILVAANVLVASKCGEPVPGEMNLRGTMEARVSGGFVIDGSQDCVVCGYCFLSGASNSAVIAGGETPPIVRVKDSAKLRIGGSLMLLGGSQLVHTSSSPIEVSGDFINESVCPQCFDMSGAIVFQPQGFAVAANVANPIQNIEVAGRDLGPSPEGFSTNFAFSALEIAPSTLVNFVDSFPNSGGAGTEALYVDTLVLRDGATVTLSDCRVYYNNLMDEGAMLEYIGTGALVRVAAQVAIPAVSTWGLVVIAMGLAVAGSILVISRRPISTR